MLLASLLTLATNMEDPFDDGSPDMLSFYEAKDHILFVSAKCGVSLDKVALFMSVSGSVECHYSLVVLFAKTLR